MLEAAQYTDNAFITLTYADEFLPRLSEKCSGTLLSKHLQDFLKRLRFAWPTQIRFYGVGEYGDENWRPHYHVALFNFPTCVRGRTLRRVGSGGPVWRDCCEQCRLVGEKWGFGNVDLGILEVSSAQYVAGYITKKMTRRDDYRLEGREPEFSRMSLRPGIGFSAMHEVASSLMQFNLDTTQTDIPVSLRHGSRELPLGRYLRRKLRLMVGKDEKTPQVVLDTLKEEMQPVRKAAFDASRSFKKEVLAESKGQRAKFYAKQNLKKKGRLL